MEPTAPRTVSFEFIILISMSLTPKSNNTGASSDGRTGPSYHDAMAQVLIDLGLQFAVSKGQVNKRAGHMYLVEFISKNWTTINDKDSLVGKLFVAIANEEYGSENEFNKKVFEAFQDHLLESVKQLDFPDTLAPLWLNKDQNWAICLANESTMASEYTAGPAPQLAKSDHSIVLVEPDEEKNWVTRFTTAVIEFKMLQKSVSIPDGDGGPLSLTPKDRTNMMKGPGNQ